MGRKNFGAKAYSYPQPVFIIATYDENGNPNAMNAAWGGISEENEVSVCLSPNHKTCKNFAKTGAFTISMADAAHVAGCDYVGIASGNNTEDKFAKAGFTAVKSELVNASTNWQYAWSAGLSAMMRKPVFSEVKLSMSVWTNLY